MLIKVIPGVGHTAYYSGDEPLHKGCFVYVAGAATASDAVNKFGYVRAGFPIVKKAESGTYFNVSGVGHAVYPVTSVTLVDSGSDIDQDVIVSGQECVYYVGGEYMTDQYDTTTVTTGSAVPGAKLYLNDEGKLTTAPPSGSGFATPLHVATVVQLLPAPASSDFFARRLLWFRMA